MILEEYTFDKDVQEPLPGENTVVKGNRVKKWDSRRAAIEFGARGKHGSGFRALSGYETNSGDIVVYATERHARTAGLENPGTEHELPFEKVMYGSEVAPWSYSREKDEFFDQSSETDYSNALDVCGVEDVSNMEEVVTALLSVPEDEKTATSEIYVRGKDAGGDLGYTGDPEPLVDAGVVEETGISYPGGYEAKFYHTEHPELLGEAKKELDLEDNSLELSFKTA